MLKIGIGMGCYTRPYGMEAGLARLKSQGYDAAWVSIQALAQSGASKETVLTRIKSLVAQDRITDYEAEMMLVNLGYRTSSAGTGRNTIGPNNVQMVQ